MRLLARGDRLAPSEKSGPVGHQGAATRRAGLALIVLAGCCCLAAPAAGDLYRWTDAEGTVHYTADLASIPPTFRDTATPLNTPQARPIPPPTANEPVALKVSPGAPITVEARLNGVGLTLIVDTGADRTVISPEVIERAGLAGGAGRSVQVIGVTGTSTATLVTLPLLDVAGARIGPIVVVAHPLPSTFRGSDAVDGLLGRDVLDAFTLSVDTASGRATLTPR
ncbi:MAG: hypothetical protein DME00_14205 [Candidatus Rokuibacteriota bacterium]|nr:MAG: hypothetical protein DME00_14205 [Candidatus Rokubacteria bacterium]